jgi:hypothetical protein
MLHQQQIRDSGFAIVPGVLDQSEQRQLINALGKIDGAGQRGLLRLPIVAHLTLSTRLLNLVRPHLPQAPHPVRAIYFSKSSETNWLVPWHQDLTLAVCARVESPGFGPWSIKEGIPHVQPPAEFLEQMLAIRLHLDDCDETNGALRLLPGTHRSGRLNAEQVQTLRQQDSELICRLNAGDALLMRPLLLHASSRSQSSRPRRVLHIEYAGCNLPEGLDWHAAA